jgi:hypothetical protein
MKMTDGEKMIWAAAFARHIGFDEDSNTREACGFAFRAVRAAREARTDYADCGGEGPDMIRQMTSDPKE